MAINAAALPAAVDVKASRRALVAGSVGNMIEWYEAGAYGFFATIIASNFFSGNGASDAESLIKTYASFALAFFFRPVGAAIFGRVGDRIGRRPTLVLVLILMSGATTLIGLLPTYASIGIWAPILLTLLRILQGLSAGGEFGGAISLMTEFAPQGKRGLYGAWQSFTVAVGLLAGAGLAALLASLLTVTELASWGWRIPFLLAFPLGLVALWLRLRLEETPSFLRTAAVAKEERTRARNSPGRVLDSQMKKPGGCETLKAIALGVGRIMGWSAAGYTFLVVMPTYLQTSLGQSIQAALMSTVAANIGFAAVILPAGMLSDRIGRRTVMLTGAILTIILALPLIGVLNGENSALTKAFAVLVAGGAVGLMAGPGPAMLSEMFSTSVRYTGLGLAYSLSNAVFSGCAGLIITELITVTTDIRIPAYYVMVACFVSVLALMTLRGDDHLRKLKD